MEQRMRKDEAEIAAVAAACAMTDKIFTQLLPHIRPASANKRLMRGYILYAASRGDGDGV